MRLDATDPKWKERHRHLFTCDCVDSHFLEVEWIEDDEDWPGYLEVNETIYAPTIWGRIKAATRILFGHRYYHGGVVLDPETTDKLIESLDEQRKAARARKGKENGEVEQAS